MVVALIHFRVCGLYWLDFGRLLDANQFSRFSLKKSFVDLHAINLGNRSDIVDMFCNLEYVVLASRSAALSNWLAA
jgi:hypothetical protein